MAEGTANDPPIILWHPSAILEQLQLTMFDRPRVFEWLYSGRVIIIQGVQPILLHL